MGKKCNRFIILIFMCFMLNGCTVLNMMSGLFKGASSNAGYESSENYTKELIEDKKEGLKYYKLTKSRDKIIPKLTFAQKIGKWIGGLTTISIILLVIGFVVAPTATMTIFWYIASIGKKLARRAFTETAMAIKISGANSENKKLKVELKSNQSETTKKMVGDLKAKL